MLKLVKRPKPSPLQTELAEVDRSIIAARAKVSEAEAKVQRLNAIVAASEAQASALNEKMAQDDGTALERLAAGNDDTTGIAPLVERVHRMAQAARAALMTLPAADAAATACSECLDELILAKRDKIHAIVLDHADKMAADYKRTFDQLMVLHDELRAASLALQMEGCAPLCMSTTAWEVPRFDLPATRHESEYISTMRAVPDVRKINERAQWWSGVIQALSTDPFTDIKDIHALNLSDRNRGLA